MKGARLLELARALQREIRETPEEGFAQDQNGAIADMEWQLQTFIETVEGKCQMPTLNARAEERKVA